MSSSVSVAGPRDPINISSINNNVQKMALTGDLKASNSNTNTLTMVPEDKDKKSGGGGESNSNGHSATPPSTAVTLALPSAVAGPGPKTGAKASYGKIVLSLDNVVIPENKITPSTKDGLDNDAEFDLRVVGCDLIQSSGILLKLPQTAMATGQVLFHRFYYTKSFVRKAMETTAMACVYLASKIEESPRRIRDVINVFHHIKLYRSQKVLVPLILDTTYVKLKNEVVLAERHVLKELGFCVHVKHPHKLIVTIMNFLGFDDNTHFLQRSWNYMNDALRSNIFVRYPPETIACACIFLSARSLRIPLPNNPSWYSLFDAKEDHIIDICECILELYERPMINREELEKTVDKLVKIFQESRQSKLASASSNNIEKSNTHTPSTTSPSSRPASPNSLAAQAILAAARVKQEQLEKERKRRIEDDHKSKPPREEDVNSRSRDSRDIISPSRSKKPRRSPSPISDDEPRHRHKKQKKSSRSRERYSSSYNYRSRSRSRSHERKIAKKLHRRERSRSQSPYYSSRKHHHKKKSSHYK